MKFYIALGGIACSALKQYSETHPSDIFYYIDTDPATFQSLEQTDNRYLIPNFHYGTGAYRQIGRNATKYEIYSGKLGHFFEHIKQADFADVTIFTSSFGGFGSAAAIEILDLIECMLYEKPEQNQHKHCRILAFNETFIQQFGMPKTLFEQYRANTIEMLQDMASRKSLKPEIASNITRRPAFNPECTFFLLDTKGYQMNQFASFLHMTLVELIVKDVQYQYTIKAKKAAPPVFISYSSLDQSVADLLADTLAEHDISSWLATRSIKEGSYAKQIMQGIRDAKIFVVLLSVNSVRSEQVKNEIDRAFFRLGNGLKIVPFIIDDAELDDDCSYYLCRQEFYFGKKPPIKERIQELVDKIADMLE